MISAQWRGFSLALLVIGVVLAGAVAWAIEVPQDRPLPSDPTASHAQSIAGDGSGFAWRRWAGTDAPCGSTCTWEQTFGGPLDDKIAAAVQMPDGGFAIVGNTRTSRTGNYDSWVVRIEAEGTPRWRRSFGSGATDQLRDVIATADGGLFVVGHTRARGAGESDLWLLKLDADGALGFERTYGGAAHDRIHAAAPSDDGGVFLTGFTASEGAGGRDLWVTRFSPDGDLVWSRTLGGSRHDEGLDLALLADGGVAVAGHVWTHEVQGFDIAVARFSQTGDLVWQRTLDRGRFDAGTGIVATPDGRLLVVGASSMQGLGNTDLWAISLDSTGQVLWDRVYGGVRGEEPWDLTVARSGGFVVAVETFSKGEGGDIWLLGLAADGSVNWERLFGGALWEHPSALIETKDGGLLLGGHTASKGSGFEDAWLLRLTADGRL